MRNRTFYSTTVLLICLAAQYGCDGGDEGGLPPRLDYREYIERPEDIVTFDSLEEAAAALDEICAAVSAPGRTFAVTGIEDGDTIIISDGRRIRYTGIDAPETHSDRGVDDPYAAGAAEFNRKLLRGARVQLIFDEEKKDRYGRTLAYVFVLLDEDGRERKFVNAQMVLAGYALAKRFPPNIKYAGVLSGIEELAARKKKGLWRTTPSGYAASRKSDVFHRKTCKWAQKISPDNLIEFATRKEAFESGRRPCRTCKP